MYEDMDNEFEGGVGEYSYMGDFDLDSLNLESDKFNPLDEDGDIDEILKEYGF